MKDGKLFAAPPEAANTTAEELYTLSLTFLKRYANSTDGKGICSRKQAKHLPIIIL